MSLKYQLEYTILLLKNQFFIKTQFIYLANYLTMQSTILDEGDTKNINTLYTL